VPSPLVSVCIPAFNHEKYVGDAIDSVLSQTMQDFEIVITDDCSTDKTRDVITSYTDERIRFFTSPRNSGPGAAANNNLLNARGKFIALLASDDIFVPTKLETQVSFLESNPDIGAAFSWMTYVSESGDDFDTPVSTDHVDIHNRSQAEWLGYLLFSGNPFSAPTAMLRRSLVDTIGLLDSRMLQVQDLDFWIRACLKAQVHIIPERLIRYRIRANSANASANSPDQQARTYWEYSKVFSHLRQAPDELFDAAFADRVPEFAQGLPREAQLAVLALSAQAPFTRAFGLDLAYSLLGEAELVKPLQAAGIDYPWLFRTAADVDPFQVRTVEWFRAAYSTAISDIEKLKASNAEASDDNARLRAEIDRLREERRSPDTGPAHADAAGMPRNLTRILQRLSRWRS